MDVKKIFAAALTVLLMIAVPFAGAADANQKLKPDPKYGTDLPLPKGAVIEIISYDEKTDSYEVGSVNFPGEGSTFVTPEGLARAIPALDLTRLKNSPQKILSTQYKLDGVLSGLTDEELKMRSRVKKKR